MSRLTFARSAGAAGPKMTEVRYILYRQTDGALNSQGGTRSRSPLIRPRSQADLWEEEKRPGINLVDRSRVTLIRPRSQADLWEEEKRPGIDCLRMRGIPHNSCHKHGLS